VCERTRPLLGEACDDRQPSVNQGIISALLTVLFLGLVSPLLFKPLLVKLDVLDISNERSSHSGSAIRGIGLAPLLSIVVGMALIAVFGETISSTLLVVILAVSLASGMLGWFEDLRGVPVLLRAGLQLIIGFVGACLVVLPSNGIWWAVPLYAIGIAGYINVANFMDGINGMSGLHGAVVGGIFSAMGAIVGMPWLLLAGLVVALSFLCFLPWNLVRGGMFLGDVGSYLLGGSIGIIAVAAIGNGVPILSVLGPLVIYLVDTGTTLCRRILRGERWFEAHRGHTYQRLTDSGLSHIRVSAIVAGAGMLTGLVGISNVMFPEYWPLWLALYWAIALGYLWCGTAFGKSAQWHSEQVQKVRVS
jgi:UDP-N-acetylmuramyl pentapeptide phosphotransferase/UDP-N-acetylglucosamine-1-phosphate transferase